MDEPIFRAYTLHMDSAAAHRQIPSDATPRVSLLWRLFVATGVPTLTVLSTSDEAWERWEQATGGRIPRSAVRRLLVGTAVAHVIEAAVVHRRARSVGMARPGRWAAATLAWGFPVMLQLRRNGSG